LARTWKGLQGWAARAIPWIVDQPERCQFGIISSGSVHGTEPEDFADKSPFGVLQAAGDAQSVDIDASGSRQKCIAHAFGDVQRHRPAILLDSPCDLAAARRRIQLRNTEGVHSDKLGHGFGQEQPVTDASMRS